MASTYDALANYLRQQRGSSHAMRFADIEAMIGTPLPASAWKYPAWWANDRSPSSQSRHSKHGWLAAGWEVDPGSVDRIEGAVTFRSRGDIQ